MAWNKPVGVFVCGVCVCVSRVVILGFDSRTDLLLLLRSHSRTHARTQNAADHRVDLLLLLCHIHAHTQCTNNETPPLPYFSVRWRAQRALGFRVWVFGTLVWQYCLCFSRLLVYPKFVGFAMPILIRSSFSKNHIFYIHFCFYYYSTGNATSPPSRNPGIQTDSRR